jgi:hypothetical protein
MRVSTLPANQLSNKTSRESKNPNRISVYVSQLQRGRDHAQEHTYQLLRRNIKPTPSMRNLPILTKNTPQITPTKKNTPTPIVPLQTRLLPKMRRNTINLHPLRPNQTIPRAFIAIHAAKTRTEVAVPKVCIGSGAFLRGGCGGEGEVAGGVVI